ncbi:MAG: hypothetical protein ACR2J7_02665 [Luteimonas sp.]
MVTAFARAVSVLGHPLPVLSCALLVRAFHGGAGRAQLLGIGAAFALFAATVMAYSWWRVRGGHWRHVDASGVAERHQLNHFLLALLLAGTVLAAFAAQPLLALQLALAASLVLVAALAARWCKLSLHLAFAVYAAALLAPVSWGVAAAVLVLAALLAWSRLQLARHAPRDLVAGALAGLAAGMLAWRLSLHGQG